MWESLLETNWTNVNSWKSRRLNIESFFNRGCPWCCCCCCCCCLNSLLLFWRGASVCTFDKLFVRLRCVCFLCTRLAVRISAIHSVFYCLGREHLAAATPCWRDPTRSKQLSPVPILGFQFGLYHVVSFLRNYQPCFIVMFLFLTDQIFYRSYVHRQHFRLRSLASLSYHSMHLFFPFHWSRAHNVTSK